MYQEKQYTDLDLWNAFKSGDRSAYTTIYERYAGAMYAYGLRFTSDEELIEDSIHDIFVKIYSRREKLPEVSNVKLYLMVALRNTLFSFIQENKEEFRLSILDNDTLCESENIEDLIIRNENEVINKKMVTLIESILSPRQKQIIYYRYVEQLSYRDIAQLMNINVQSAKNMIQVTLKKIRSHFSGSIFALVVLLFFA